MTFATVRHIAVPKRQPRGAAHKTAITKTAITRSSARCEDAEFSSKKNNRVQSLVSPSAGPETDAGCLQANIRTKLERAPHYLHQVQNNHGVVAQQSRVPTSCRVAIFGTMNDDRIDISTLPSIWMRIRRFRTLPNAGARHRTKIPQHIAGKRPRSYSQYSVTDGVCGNIRYTGAGKRWGSTETRHAHPATSRFRTRKPGVDIHPPPGSHAERDKHDNAVKTSN